MDDMQYEQLLRTYDIWKSRYIINPEEMVKCGFKCINSSTVQCIYCKFALTDWKEDDNPYVEHIVWSKKCEFIKTLVKNSLPITFLESKSLPLDAFGLIIPMWSYFVLKYNQNSDEKHDLTCVDVNNKLYECFSCKVKIQIFDQEREEIIHYKHIILSNNKCDFLKLKIGHEMCDYIYKNKDNDVIFKNIYDSSNNADLLCGICCMNKRNVISLPCFHIYACISCYKKYKCCFMCKTQILLFAEANINENMLCSTCKSNKCELLFLPCGHVSCCNNCFKQNAPCNVCNKKILATSKVFIS